MEVSHTRWCDELEYNAFDMVAAQNLDILEIVVVNVVVCHVRTFARLRVNPSIKNSISNA